MSKKAQLGGKSSQSKALSGYDVCKKEGYDIPDSEKNEYIDE